MRLKMKTIKFLLFIFLAINLSGCFIFPINIVAPLKTTVVDSETGRPIAGAVVLRIVCDIHDYSCRRAFFEKAITDDKGMVCLDSKKEWGQIGRASCRERVS
jgi:hypothetical protein